MGGDIRAIARFLPPGLVAAVLIAGALLAGCGGGSVSSDAPAAPVPTAANELALTVDRGADGAAFNSPFATVTVCVPGTTNCQTVDHVLVDTGSFGLRLAASALSSAVSLPAAVNAAGAPVAECARFAGGYAWGSVRRADVKLSGETAANLPVQIVADPLPPYGTVPTACSTSGTNFGSNLGAKGILGVGVFSQDCPACAVSSAPGVYFACTALGCSPTALAQSSQVANPVAAFAINNNGVVVVLPEVLRGGVATLSGSLFFGIGTQPNNQLGSETVYTTDSRGRFTTTYLGATVSSILDTGSNAIFFSDPGIPQCAGFFCPQAPLTLTAVNTSSKGVTGTVSFTIESIQSIAGGTAAAHIGADAGSSRTFAWGLPFFFGRKVFVALTGAPTPNGVGPYWAY
jgi:hypothetical protein